MDILPSSLKTRIAPSPTGHLHLGHVLHLIYVQGLAKQLGASITLRIEDHDRLRCRPEYEVSILHDLEWLGFEVPSSNQLWRQSERGHVYQSKLENLMNRGLVYACRCSRKEIQEMTHQSSGELVYPGTCRDKNYPLEAPDTSIRMKIAPYRILDRPDATNTDDDFVDILANESGLNRPQELSDVVIRDRNQQWTYQFAVVIDDLEQQINFIIRGLDLLSSTRRQLMMRKILDPTSKNPIFAHHPLIIDEDGQKLAKRKSSEAISYLRRLGLSPDEVKGIAANMGGLIADRDQFPSLEKLDLLPRKK